MARKRQHPKTRAALSERCGSSRTEAGATPPGGAWTMR